MDKLRTQRYAESLEKVIQSDYHYLKGIMEVFQEKCQVVASIKNAPPRVVVEIPETYREIQHRLKEIAAVQQLLRAKYALYARRDPNRDKEVSDLGHTAKAAYSKFEHGLKKGEVEAMETVFLSKTDGDEGPFLWFRNRENLVMFLRNWRILNELDYEDAAPGGSNKRFVSKDSARSLTLFIFKGDEKFINHLQSRMLLREHDIVERYNKDELRGIMTHLREIAPEDVENVFGRFKSSEGYSKLKCLLLPVRTQKDLEKDIASLTEKVFSEMHEGEVKTLLI